ncbi:hypothetical protein R1flu_002847 [Riccia fluitans]|uniref:Uncharacterized protein n=1 Tax=Riccia fluitans TaxID=41844 RepID=A0ABD1YAA2_9MARC
MGGREGEGGVLEASHFGYINRSEAAFKQEGWERSRCRYQVIVLPPTLTRVQAAGDSDLRRGAIVVAKLGVRDPAAESTLCASLSRLDPCPRPRSALLQRRDSTACNSTACAPSLFHGIGS